MTTQDADLEAMGPVDYLVVELSGDRREDRRDDRGPGRH